jgi:diaminohydroxyphosphoribosylaminopyrimidine deaminase/5-amino-6-(5-phosphoribosylamino)uracil reductase
VICKWAQSLDGRIATHTGDSRWISGEASRRRVHELRGLCDGVCVGAGTVAADDPLLTNRSGSPSQPARVVLDGSLAISPDSQLVRTAGESPVIVATREGAPDAKVSALTAAGVEVLRLPPGAGGDGVDLPALLDEFGGREWTYLLVEGGQRILDSFIGGGLADELMVFIAPVLIGGAESIPPVRWEDVDTVDRARRLPAPEIQRVGDDVLLRYLISS